MRNYLARCSLVIGSVASTIAPISTAPVTGNVIRSTVVAGIGTLGLAGSAHAQRGSRVCSYVVGAGIAPNPMINNQQQGYVNLWYFENHKNLKFYCLAMLNGLNPQYNFTISFGNGFWGIVTSQLVKNAMNRMLKRLGYGIGQQWTGSQCESFTTKILANASWMNGNVCRKTEKYIPHVVTRWDSGHVQMWVENINGSLGKRVSPY